MNPKKFDRLLWLGIVAQTLAVVFAYTYFSNRPVEWWVVLAAGLINFSINYWFIRKNFSGYRQKHPDMGQLQTTGNEGKS